MEVLIGCNTLYAAGRLQGEASFTLPHQLRALEIIAEAGMHAVEFSHASPATAEELEKMAAHARSLGLVSWSVHAWTALAATEAQVETVIDAYRKTAEIVRILSPRVVVVHSGGGMEPEKLDERRRANTATLCALAEMVGPEVTIAVENMRFLNDWEFIIGMVDGCKVPNVGLNVDTGHANLGDLGVARAIQMAGSRLRTTHLQDNLGERDDHMPPGTGKIDWESAMAAFRAVNYPGTFMVEISDCPPAREPDAVVDTRTAARNVRAMLEKAGYSVKP